MDPDEVAVGFDGIKALASRTRYEILRALGDRRQTVSELTDDLDVTKGTVHRHLQTLVDAGFVERLEDERMWVYYELTPTGEALAASDRPRVVLRFSTAIVALAAAVLAGLRTVTLHGTDGAGGGQGAPGAGPGPGPEQTSGLLQDPMVWIVVAGTLVIVAIAAYVLARRAALGPPDRGSG